jgi:hypothetical protein
MKKLLSVTVIFILTSFTPTEPPKELSIKLSVEDINTILFSLSKQPYEQAAPLIQKITIQAQKQLSDTTKKQK